MKCRNYPFPLLPPFQFWERSHWFENGFETTGFAGEFRNAESMLFNMATPFAMALIGAPPPSGTRFCGST